MSIDKKTDAYIRECGNALLAKKEGAYKSISGILEMLGTLGITTSEQLNEERIRLARQRDLGTVESTDASLAFSRPYLRIGALMAATEEQVDGLPVFTFTGEIGPALSVVEEAPAEQHEQPHAA